MQQGVFIYESNRNRTPNRRPGAGGDPQGDPPHHAYPRGRPVTDNIGTVGAILLCDAGAGEKMGKKSHLNSRSDIPVHRLVD